VTSPASERIWYRRLVQLDQAGVPDVPPERAWAARLPANRLHAISRAFGPPLALARPLGRPVSAVRPEDPVVVWLRDRRSEKAGLPAGHRERRGGTVPARDEGSPVVSGTPLGDRGAVKAPERDRRPDCTGPMDVPASRTARSAKGMTPHHHLSPVGTPLRSDVDRFPALITPEAHEPSQSSSGRRGLEPCPENSTAPSSSKRPPWSRPKADAQSLRGQSPLRLPTAPDSPGLPCLRFVRDDSLGPPSGRPPRICRVTWRSKREAVRSAKNVPKEQPLVVSRAGE
jgi:hypothetical protein